MRILVVEDDLHARRALANILGSAGYTVELAGDGFEALDKIRAQRPDLVLLDAVMPGLDGFGVLAEVRRMADPPPVIGITAISDHEAFARFLASGAVAYLCKPVSMHELLAAVRLALAPRGEPAPAEAVRREPVVEHMVGVRPAGGRGGATLLGELKEVLPEHARVMLLAPLEVGSRVRVLLHASIAGRPLGFEATVQWCAAAGRAFAHGLGALEASKETWDRLLTLFGSPAASG